MTLRPSHTRGSMRRGRGGAGARGGNFGGRTPKEVLSFDSDYDFELANAEFQELENKLSQTKIADKQDGVESEKEQADSEGEGPDQQVAAEAAAVTPQENPEPPAADFYNKAKSFFDNISCEAVERSKGSLPRVDWRQERKLNTETFGVSASNSNWLRRNAWRGRGGYRGRGGGYYRGGRGSSYQAPRRGGGMNFRNNNPGLTQSNPVSRNRVVNPV